MRASAQKTQHRRRGQRNKERERPALCSSRVFLPCCVGVVTSKTKFRSPPLWHRFFDPGGNYFQTLINRTGYLPQNCRFRLMGEAHSTSERGTKAGMLGSVWSSRVAVALSAMVPP